MAQLENGYPFDSELFSPSAAVPLVRIRDLTATEFETFVPEPVPERVMLRDGDVVIGMDGDFNVVRWTRGPAALNQRLCRLRGTDSADLRFVAYALPTPLKWINETQYATTVKHLSSEEVLTSRVPCPPLNEQRRIADFLDDQVARIDNIIAARRAQIDDILAELRSAFSDEVTMLMATHPTARLARFYDYVEQGSSPNGDAVAAEPGEFGVLKTSAVQRGRFAADENKLLREAVGFEPRYEVRNGDLLVVRGSGSADLVADAAVVELPTSHPRLMLSDLIYRLRGLRLLPSFAAALLTSAPLRGQIRAVVRQGSGPAKARVDDIAGLAVPALELSEQRARANNYWSAREGAESACESLARSANLLEEFKRSLITAAVTGEFDMSAASGRHGE